MEYLDKQIFLYEGIKNKLINMKLFMFDQKFINSLKIKQNEIKTFSDEIILIKK